MPDQCPRSPGHACPALSVSFNDVPEYMNVPIRGYGKFELTKIGEDPRYFYEKEFPVGYKPPTCHQSIRDAQAAAKMFWATIVQKPHHVPAKCKYECDAKFRCKHCIPADLTVSRPARSSSKLPALDIEWIWGAGSAQDLISERDLSGMTARDSDHPISSMTANGPGPSSADKQFAVYVPSIGIASDPYVLPDTPAVLSIGQRCMGEGFDFVRKAYSKPYLKMPRGEEIYLDVRDNVPYLKSWPENTAVLASHVPQCAVQTPTQRKGPALDESELQAKKLLANQDFSHKSCLGVISKAKFKGQGAQRKAITTTASGPSGSAQYAVLGVYCHGGVAGVTNETNDRPELTKYVCAYLKSKGVDEPCSRICINHGSSVKAHKGARIKFDSVNLLIGSGDYSDGDIWINDEMRTFRTTAFERNCQMGLWV